MQIDESKLKSFHIGTNNIIEFQEWYQDLESRIDIARIQYFKEKIGGEENDESKWVSIREEKLTNNLEGIGNKSKLLSNPSNASENKGKMKTITELVIDKQLKEIQEFDEL